MYQLQMKFTLCTLHRLDRLTFAWKDKTDNEKRATTQALKTCALMFSGSYVSLSSSASTSQKLIWFLDCLLIFSLLVHLKSNFT